MTLLINSIKRFWFCWLTYQNSLSTLFSQCKVSPCERNTHLLANVGQNCCSISAQRTTKQISNLLRFVDNLKTPTRTWKCTRCTMQMRYSYTSDLPFKNFCKLAKRAETIRNYQKQVLVIIKHCLGNSQIISIPSKQFSCMTFLYWTNTKVYVYN